MQQRKKPRGPGRGDRAGPRAPCPAGRPSDTDPGSWRLDVTNGNDVPHVQGSAGGDKIPGKCSQTSYALPAAGKGDFSLPGAGNLIFVFLFIFIHVQAPIVFLSEKSPLLLLDE